MCPIEKVANEPENKTDKSIETMRNSDSEGESKERFYSSVEMVHASDLQ